jgi:hypothetical protein
MVTFFASCFFFFNLFISTSSRISPLVEVVVTPARIRYLHCVHRLWN